MDKMPLNLLLVFVGGGVGTLFRYVIAVAMASKSAVFPWGTLAINILAALLFGFFFTLTAKTDSTSLRLLLCTGFCGGFSTFSTFSFENYQLIQQGNFGLLAAYILTSVIACLIGIKMGMMLY
jgi:CrcB protein